MCYVISLSADALPEQRKAFFSLPCEGFKCGHVTVELNDYKLSEAEKWSNNISCNKSALTRNDKDGEWGRVMWTLNMDLRDIRFA